LIPTNNNFKASDTYIFSKGKPSYERWLPVIVMVDVFA